MTGEAHVLAGRFNVERFVGPCTGGSVKQSQFWGRGPCDCGLGIADCGL